MHTYVMLDKAVAKFPQVGLRCMCYAGQGSRKVPTGGCAMHTYVMLDKAVAKFPQVGVRCIPMLCWTRQWKSSDRWVCDAYLCYAGQGSGKVPTGGVAMHVLC